MRKPITLLFTVMLIVWMTGCARNYAEKTKEPVPGGEVGGDWRVMQSYGHGSVNDELSLLYAYYTGDQAWGFFWDKPSRSTVFVVDGSLAENPGNWGSVDFRDMDGDGNNEIVIAMEPLGELVLRWDEESDDFTFYDEEQEDWFFDEEYRPRTPPIAGEGQDDEDGWRANGLPPELGAPTGIPFDSGIITSATVSVNQWSPNSNRPYIYVTYAVRDGAVCEPADFAYGIPPVPAEEYIKYLEQEYGESYISNPYVDYELDPEFDFGAHKPGNWFFETELLHRGMVFHVWDGSTYIGTGRIAKTPEFITYSYEIFIQAEFRMDDPSITLPEDIEYTAITGEWQPFPREPAWIGDDSGFEIDVDGNGSYVRGSARMGAYESDSDDEQQPWFLDIVYRDGEYEYELGDQYSEGDLPNYIKFMDMDGDGRLEMIVSVEWSGGWGEEVVFFGEDQPITKLVKLGSY